MRRTGVARLLPNLALMAGAVVLVLLGGRREPPNADLEARFDSLGIRAHDLGPDFVERMTGDGRAAGDFYHDEIHYRASGNTAAGEVLAAHLARALAADSAPSRGHGMSPAPQAD